MRKLFLTIVLLLVTGVLAAGCAPTPAPTPTLFLPIATQTPLQTNSPKPTNTEIPPSPTLEPYKPTGFENLYYARLDGGITRAVRGEDIEKNNPGIKALTINGVSVNSEVNTIINRNYPNITAGFSTDHDQLLELFNAKEVNGVITGHLPDGTEVQLINNVWVDTQGNIFNPIVANRAGHPYGIPTLAMKDGQLVIALTDTEYQGVVIKGSSWQSLFKKPADIAEDAKPVGFTGDLTKVSRVGIDKWGNIVCFEKDGRKIAVLPFLQSSAVALNPTDTPNPYENFNPVEGTTYTADMKAFYQKLPDIVKLGATEQDIALEKKAHLDYTRGLIDFLGRQGRDVSAWKNYTEADLLNYDKAIEIHQAFWTWQLENYNKTGVYQLSPVDPWLEKEMGGNINN